MRRSGAQKFYRFDQSRTPTGPERGMDDRGVNLRKELLQCRMTEDFMSQRGSPFLCAIEDQKIGLMPQQPLDRQGAIMILEGHRSEISQARCR